MYRRRTLARVLLTGALISGCASPATQARPDLVFLSIRSGLVVIDGTTGLPVLDAGVAAYNADWSRVFAAATDAGTTHVSVYDVARATTREIARVKGVFTPAIVSRRGELLALTAPRPDRASGVWDPARRERTELVVVSASGEVRRFDLPGNFEPEAFTADASTLVLLQYLPAIRPDRYRLRELHLSDGSVAALGARIKLLAPDEMRATGRTQVAAPDGSALYTLYTRQGPALTHLAPGAAPIAGSRHAFIHVLNLTKGFAHCIDLPDGFGTGPAALALSPDGHDLVAIDAARAVVVDIRAFSLARSVPIGIAGLRPAGAAVSDREIFVGSGSEVIVLDRESLSVVRRMPLRGTVRGMVLNPDESALYALLEDEVFVLDLRTRSVLRSFPEPGAIGIDAAIRQPEALEASR